MLVRKLVNINPASSSGVVLPGIQNGQLILTHVVSWGHTRPNFRAQLLLIPDVLGIIPR
jgi:hypothetical protein